LPIRIKVRETFELQPVTYSTRGGGDLNRRSACDFSDCLGRAALNALIRWLSHCYAANVNQLAAEPTRNSDQQNADDREQYREIIAGRTLRPQPKIHAVKPNREQINNHVPNTDRF
jgi:hypothetical protein